MGTAMPHGQSKPPLLYAHQSNLEQFLPALAYGIWGHGSGLVPSWMRRPHPHCTPAGTRKATLRHNGDVGPRQLRWYQRRFTAHQSCETAWWWEYALHLWQQPWRASSWRETSWLASKQHLARTVRRRRPGANNRVKLFGNTDGPWVISWIWSSSTVWQSEL